MLKMECLTNLTIIFLRNTALYVSKYYYYIVEKSYVLFKIHIVLIT